MKWLGEILYFKIFEAYYWIYFQKLCTNYIRVAISFPSPKKNVLFYLCYIFFLKLFNLREGNVFHCLMSTSLITEAGYFMVH